MAQGVDIKKRRLAGYLAGFIAGVSYGTNPLFAKPLLESGVPVLVMLLFRYGISAAILAVWMLAKREQFRVKGNEIALLVLLGILFACSSLFLFFSYEFIPSGLATTLVYLYPVFVALIMVFLRFYPSWQTWLSIIATFGGILLLSSPSTGASIRIPGIILAVASALSYAFYLVIVNRSKRIKNVSEHTLTLYALLTGAFLFAAIRTLQGGSITEGINTASDWGNLIGLAIVPTMISLLTLAVSSRYIGPTKTSILGVFEPLTAILIGTLLFGESLTMKMGIGVAVCISAVVFMVLRPDRKVHE
ncbi:MAG: DMT family transporter [Bacteroidales bacterium]|nr:DMT family transporter [Bacteroidales bacterium]MBR0300850.1 DMT family transporter [Bacteroidales bacterium]